MFLHLAKNGGGSIERFLAPIRDRWYHTNHAPTLPQLVERFPSSPIMFFVRHPVSRFVSGFNNFRRERIQGVPKRPDPSIIISSNYFQTPDELAVGLVSDDERIRSAAEYAITNLPFLGNPMVNNLISADTVDSYRDNIRFIGTQEDFVESIEAMRNALGLPAHLTLPNDELTAHRAPDTLPKSLSDTGRAAVLHWYRDDIPLYEHCCAIHREHMEMYRT